MTAEPASIDEIRARSSRPVTEIVANPREYYRVQQLLRDRVDLLAHCDRLQAELKEARRCKHPTRHGTGSISSDGKIVTGELYCSDCGEKLS